MPEPKKETVRIIPPARKGDAPAPLNPQGGSPINLPPKPVKAPVAPPSAPSIPAIPKPPSVPSIPKPPSSGPSISPPRAPAAAPSGITPPKAPSPPAATAPKPSITSPAPTVAPAPIKLEAKKETAKVPTGVSSAKVLPQATVQLQKSPAPSLKPGASAAITVAPSTATESDNPTDPNSIFYIAALITALLAFIIQLWIMLT